MLSDILLCLTFTFLVPSLDSDSLALEILCGRHGLSDRVNFDSLCMNYFLQNPGTELEESYLKFVKLNLEQFRAHLSDEKMKKQLIKVRSWCFVRLVGLLQRYWFLKKLLCFVVTGMVHVHNNEDMWLGIRQNEYGVTPVPSADSAHARSGKSLLKLLIFPPKRSIFYSRLLGYAQLNHCVDILWYVLYHNFNDPAWSTHPSYCVAISHA